MSRRDLARVIAMVTVDFRPLITDLAVQHGEALRDVRIDVPAEQHPFVEAVDIEKIGALHQLKITGAVVEDDRGAEHDLIDVQSRAPLAHCVDGFPCVVAIEALP